MYKHVCLLSFITFLPAYTCSVSCISCTFLLSYKLLYFLENVLISCIFTHMFDYCSTLLKNMIVVGRMSLFSFLYNH